MQGKPNQKRKPATPTFHVAHPQPIRDARDRTISCYTALDELVRRAKLDELRGRGPVLCDGAVRIPLHSPRFGPGHCVVHYGLYVREGIFAAPEASLRAMKYSFRNR